MILLILLIIICNICSANVIKDIKLINNSDYDRIIFSLESLPEYYVENKDDFINVRFSNTKMNNSVLENFRKINNTKCLETVDSQKYLRFKITGKFKRYIYIKPSKYNKDHRVIVDINKDNKEVADIDSFLTKNILTNNDKKELKIDDLINLSLSKNERENTLDDLLNEIIELKILEKEIRKEQDELNNFLSNSLLNRQNKNIKEIKKLVKKDYITIVIDAGHGGKDPGAISKKNTLEKNINLEYAIALKKELTKNKKIKVYLTRDNDIFLSLTERLNVAREHKPDLFISLHSNTSSNKNTRGLSIYTLSKEASDTRTADLANSENKSNIIGGMNLFDEYQDTINTLVDLSRKEILIESRAIAEKIIHTFKANNVNLMEKPHKQANFAVLLAPDFPSVLIELGFLSNQKDEKMLKTNLYKKTFAKSMCDTINKIFPELNKKN